VEGPSLMGAGLGQKRLNPQRKKKGLSQKKKKKKIQKKKNVYAKKKVWWKENHACSLEKRITKRVKSRGKGDRYGLGGKKGGVDRNRLRRAALGEVRGRF